MGVYILKKIQNIKTLNISFFEVNTNAQITIWTYVFTYKYLIGFKNIFTLNTKSWNWKLNENFDFFKALINSFLAYHVTKKENNFPSKMTNLLEFKLKLISFNLITTHVKCSKSCWHHVLLCTLTSSTNVFRNMKHLFHVSCDLYHCLLHAKRHI